MVRCDVYHPKSHKKKERRTYDCRGQVGPERQEERGPLRREEIPDRLGPPHRNLRRTCEKEARKEAQNTDTRRRIFSLFLISHLAKAALVSSRLRARASAPSLPGEIRGNIYLVI